ncbi:MAG: hypothetical protein M1383_02260 [Patescibacteria group bacterium]|nr:hypothetical protein [Patescibacteria group bacterium]
MKKTQVNVKHYGSNTANPEFFKEKPSDILSKFDPPDNMGKVINYSHFSFPVLPAIFLPKTISESKLKMVDSAWKKPGRKNALRFSAAPVPLIAVLTMLWLAAIIYFPQNQLNQANKPVQTYPPVPFQQIAPYQQPQAIPFNYLGPVSKWIVLQQLFGQANSPFQAQIISQWIALQGLFSNGASNFYNLDEVSKWIVLYGLFANQGPPTRAQAISQWIALQGLFGNGPNGFNSLDPVSQWVILQGLFSSPQGGS